MAFDSKDRKRFNTYIKFSLLTFLLIVITAAFAGPSKLAASDAAAPLLSKAQFAEGEVLVVMKSPALVSAARSAAGSRANSMAKAARVCNSESSALAKDVGASVVQSYSALSASSEKVLMHLRSKTKTADELIAELQKNPNVVSAAKNYITEVSATPDDTRYSQQWGLKKINAPTVWDTTTGSSDIITAVIDTGVIYDHPDLKDNIYKFSDGSYGMMFHSNGSSTKITGPATDGALITSWDRVGDIMGHGTHVAGIIGAVGNNGQGVAGVNWKVKILTVGVFSPVLDNEGNIFNVAAYDADVINGLNYIVDQKKNNGLNIRVANMSLGHMTDILSDDCAFGLAVKSASDADIIVCMSAGNDSRNLDTESAYYQLRNYPSSFKFDNTIAVGATAADDSKVSFSNYSPSGEWVDVFAPGSNILSTCRPTPLDAYPEFRQTYNASGYTYASGTSMASPMAAGAAALLCAAFPTKTAGKIKALLTNSASGVCKAGFSKYGQIDIAAAMTYKTLVTSITLDRESLPLTPGKTAQLLAEVTPDDATDKTIVWSSNNTDAATVNQSGLVTAEAEGTATITASAADGSGKTAACTVAVRREESGSSGGGGCSAGIPIFSLLASAPLFLRRRKKSL